MNAQTVFVWWSVAAIAWGLVATGTYIYRGARRQTMQYLAGTAVGVLGLFAWVVWPA